MKFVLTVVEDTANDKGSGQVSRVKAKALVKSVGL